MKSNYKKMSIKISYFLLYINKLYLHGPINQMVLVQTNDKWVPMLANYGDVLLVSKSF